ncbi:uncharacterized protein K452DRAFT_284779 [Aplosporella prunicola CBS 121167]|uniref:Uncharacterized protein n=1 Tax=Aplosporella prunicola CBS 121167 TaxID=1176127 RepID=A0A6A6BM33_9PEZI|nr:uncharacterized protein K452DRAFT_284779 [Aplosporella prunicola CBS 121167]KAF2144463.1 hypothetical protein K452DRAFT_284779 [Aplosporella prunicola CBS 121167]
MSRQTPSPFGNLKRLFLPGLFYSYLIVQYLCIASSYVVVLEIIAPLDRRLLGQTWQGKACATGDPTGHGGSRWRPAS